MAHEKKDRDFGNGVNPCKRCGKTRGVIRKYNLNVCRKCFREIAETMGWKKYN